MKRTPSVLPAAQPRPPIPREELARDLVRIAFERAAKLRVKVLLRHAGGARELNADQLFFEPYE